ncbi:MAG: hypothetical protein JSS89_06065 [Bacteroidetes bacterium]|nr:hypothetical protein [Bacteroidota bacterium]
MLRISVLVLTLVAASFQPVLAQHTSRSIAIDGQRRNAMIRTGEKGVLSYFNVDRGDTTARVLIMSNADTVKYRFIDLQGDTLGLSLRYPVQQYLAYLQRYEMFAGSDGSDSLEVLMPAIKGALEPILRIGDRDSAHFVMRNGEIRSEMLLAVTRDTVYLAGGAFDPEKPNGATLFLLAVKDIVAVSGIGFPSSDTVARIPLQGDARQLVQILRDRCSIEPLYVTTVLPEITRDPLMTSIADDSVVSIPSVPLQDRTVVRGLPFVHYGLGAEAPRMTLSEVNRNRIVRSEVVQQSDSVVLGGGVSGRYAVTLNESFDAIAGVNIGMVKATVSQTSWNARESTTYMLDLLGGAALVLSRFDEAGYRRFSCSIGLCAGLEFYQNAYTARAHPSLYNAIGDDATINATATTIGFRPIIELDVTPSIRLSRQWSLSLLAAARYTPISTQSIQVQYQGVTGVFQMNVDYPTGVALLFAGGIGVSYAL